MFGEHKSTITAYVVILGNTLSQIKAAFVVTKNYHYQTKTRVDAVDFCFEMHKILLENYSFVCDQVWEFIGREVYDFKKTGDITFAVIEALRKFAVSL